jgi:hypothetical protein
MELVYDQFGFPNVTFAEPVDVFGVAKGERSETSIAEIGFAISMLHSPLVPTLSPFPGQRKVSLIHHRIPSLSYSLE